MNKSIIKKIAKANGVSVGEVRREMKFAIEAAYANPNSAALIVPRKDKIPTPEEFILYCTQMIKSQNS